MISRVLSASISEPTRISQFQPLAVTAATVLCQQMLLSRCGPLTHRNPLRRWLWVQTLSLKATMDLDALTSP